ncbi:unnamed protein product [Arctogadus glacialis]
MLICCLSFKHVTLVHIYGELGVPLSILRLYKGLCDFFCCQKSKCFNGAEAHVRVPNALFDTVAPRMLFKWVLQIIYYSAVDKLIYI